LGQIPIHTTVAHILTATAIAGSFSTGICR